MTLRYAAAACLCSTLLLATEGSAVIDHAYSGAICKPENDSVDWWADSFGLFSDEFSLSDEQYRFVCPIIRDTLNKASPLDDVPYAKMRVFDYSPYTSVQCSFNAYALNGASGSEGSVIDGTETWDVGNFMLDWGGTTVLTGLNNWGFFTVECELGYRDGIYNIYYQERNP